jgi:hypothetical protein
MLADRDPVCPWTDDRVRIHERLREVDASCGAMYRYAIDMLGEPAHAGETAARAALIGHCVRELMNSLPDALCDVVGMPERGHNSESEVSRLARGIERDNLMEYHGEVSVDENPRLVTVRSDLLQLAVAVAVEHRAGQGRRRGRDAALVLGRLDPTDAAMVPWTRAREFFMRPTHLGTSAPPTDEEILLHIGVIEASLSARLGDFFDNLDALSEILADANGIVSGDEA